MAKPKKPQKAPQSPEEILKEFIKETKLLDERMTRYRSRGFIVPDYDLTIPNDPTLEELEEIQEMRRDLADNSLVVMGDFGEPISVREFIKAQRQEQLEHARSIKRQRKAEKHGQAKIESGENIVDLSEQQVRAWMHSQRQRFPGASRTAAGLDFIEENLFTLPNTNTWEEIAKMLQDAGRDGLDIDANIAYNEPLANQFWTRLLQYLNASPETNAKFAEATEGNEDYNTDYDDG